jgi:DNA-binding CsgD family transcriptional regulator
MPLASFIEQSNRAETLSLLVHCFCQALQNYGYSNYCNFSIDDVETDTDEPVVNGALHYHKPLIEEYRKHKYIEIDPVYKLFLRTRMPFTWDQVKQLPLNKKQQDIMALRKNAGIVMGISLPIQSADPRIVGMSIKSDLPDAPAGKDTVSQFYALGNQFHLRRASLMSPDQLSLPDISLSPREKEMLLWCSQGKSNSVIAEILSISEKTVEFHFSSVFRKLNVSSRTMAVLKAVNLRLING